MDDRRTDDTPLAPRRTLNGPSRAEDQESDPPKRPLTERVSAAISTAGQAVANAGSPRQTEGKSGGGTSSTGTSSTGTSSTDTSSTGTSSTGTSSGTARRQDREPVRPPRPSQATTASKAPEAKEPVPPRPRRVRKARLRLTHVDPWSVMKTAFLLSIAFGIVTVIAVAVVWSVLGAAGVWDSINQTVRDVLGGDTGTTFDVENYVGTSRVMGFTMIVAVVDVVLISAIATLGAFLYNLAAALLGGIEVTLAEDER